MTIFTGEICTACGRPILVDENAPQVARCRSCDAPYHTRCWFSTDEKCIRAGCDGKASDIRESKVAAIGEVCPFLPPVAKRDGGEPTPAKCLKTACMLFDAAEGRCGLGEVAYLVAAVRQGSRDLRATVSQASERSAAPGVRLLTEIGRRIGGQEASLKALATAEERAEKAMESSAALLAQIKDAIQALVLGQSGTSEQFDRLARAVEASGVGEQVRARREMRQAARLALRDGRPGAAVSLLVEAQKRGPDDAVSGDLATAYVHAGQSKRAEELLDRVLATSPDNTPCRITLAALKLQAGEAAAAELLLKDAPAPANPLLRAELAYARACVAYAVGRSEDAVALLNQALDEDPWHSAAAAALSDLRARRVGEPVPDAAAIAVGAAREMAAARG